MKRIYSRWTRDKAGAVEVAESWRKGSKRAQFERVDTKGKGRVVKVTIKYEAPQIIEVTKQITPKSKVQIERKRTPGGYHIEVWAVFRRKDADKE